MSGNSFKNYYELPLDYLKCNYRNVIFKCYYANKSNIKYDAVIYNGNRKFPKNGSHGINIIMTTEKLSQVLFMKRIGEGKDKNYQLGIDYRLFNNKYHISYPIYSDYDMENFIIKSNNNFGSVESFLNRKDVVYIQRVPYKNRRYLVREFMKYIPVDSYGKDLNNIIWPKNISRKNKVAILKDYKFCIAIENSIILWEKGNKFEATLINNDYVTEKLADCLLAGSIPIYFGPQNIERFIPHSQSIINFSSFESVEKLTLYLKKIMNNKDLLKPHLQWHFDISNKWIKRFNNTYHFTYCKICNYVYAKRRY